MKNRVKNRKVSSPIVSASLATFALVHSTFSMAAGEGADIPGLVEGALATVGLIGAAVLSVYAAIKIFKLVRAAI